MSVVLDKGDLVKWTLDDELGIVLSNEVRPALDNFHSYDEMLFYWQKEKTKSWSQLRFIKKVNK